MIDLLEREPTAYPFVPVTCQSGPMDPTRSRDTKSVISVVQGLHEESVRDAELQRLREELEEHKRRLVELEGTHQKKADIPEWLAQHDKQEGISKRELQLYTDQEIGGKRYVCYSNGEWKEWK
ncbi:unnamed protein product [Heligmosomoides polygyrus]|uniref:PHM7_ext domain-containing protein n=1 Tax=Heligmosomoides polygyrus TaxID=6339 RepID=A0A183GPJ1_HELPZ|nr:unnamed protein product [Heligmosomoides polygyrus]